MVKGPVVGKTKVQLPVPPMRVIGAAQLGPVLVTFTVPSGVAPAPLTVTFTVTVPPAAEGSGKSLVMTVVLGPWAIAWDVEVELPM